MKKKLVILLLIFDINNVNDYFHIEVLAEYEGCSLVMWLYLCIVEYNHYAEAVGSSWI